MATTLTNADVQALAQAVLTQLLRDLSSPSPAVRLPAAADVRSGCVHYWLVAFGLPSAEEQRILTLFDDHATQAIAGHRAPLAPRSGEYGARRTMVAH